MQTFEFDAKTWTNVVPIYDALLSALEAPEWHGYNLNALIDSMVYGDINIVEPPYTLRFKNVGYASEDVQEHLSIIVRYIGEAVQERLTSYGDAPTIVFEIEQ